MSENIKKSIALIALILAVLCGVVYALLSGTTFYADLVAEKVNNAFMEAGGYSLSIEELRGNPITGVHGRGVSITHDGVQIAKADAVAMNLAFSSLASGSPKLALLEFSKLDASYDIVSSHLPPKKQESSAPPSLDALELDDAIFTTPWGEIAADRMILDIGSDFYRIFFQGTYRGIDTNLKAIIESRDDSMRLADLKAKWDVLEVEASGALTPSVFLECSARNLNIDKIGEIVPEIKRSTVGGVFDAKMSLSINGEFFASGDLSSQSADISGIPFESLKTDLCFEKNVISLNEIDARLLGGTMNGAALIDLVSGDTPKLTLKLSAGSLDTRALTDALPWLEQFKGAVDSASCDLSGPIDSLSGTAYLSSESLYVTDFDCSNVTAAINLKDSSELQLSFLGETLGAIVESSGDIALSQDVILDLKLSASPLSLAAIGEKYPEIRNMSVSGDGRGSAKLKGPVSDLVFTGSVNFSDLTVSDKYKLRDFGGMFNYSKEGLSFNNIKMTWNDAAITAEGILRQDHITGDSKLLVNGTIANLQISKLEDMAPAIKDINANGLLSGKWEVSGDAKDPAARFDLKIPSLKLKNDFALSNIQADGSYRGGSIDITGATLNYGQTTLTASGAVKLPKDNSPMEYNIKGSFSDVDPALFSKLYTTPGNISGALDGEVSVWKGLSDEGVQVYFKDSDLLYDEKLHFRGLTGAISISGGKITLQNMRSDTSVGSLLLNGVIKDSRNGKTLSETANSGVNFDDVTLDVSTVVSSADIGRLSRLLVPSARGYQGFINCSMDIKGPVLNPEFLANGSIFGVRAFGLFLPVISFESAGGNSREVRLPKIRAAVGRGIISADAQISKTSGEWGGYVRASGQSVDIRSIVVPLEYEMRRDIRGILDFDFQGSGSLKSFEGSGNARIPALSVMGINFAEVDVPFWVNEGFVVVEDSSAKAYGGEVKMQMAKDLRLSNWGGILGVKSADMRTFMKDLTPNSAGVVSGSADLTFRLSGDTRRTSMQDGEGSFEIKNGEISGFEGTEAVSKLIGGRPLRFNSLLLSFSVDGKTVYVLPGSRVSAPKGDPVFNYLMADGKITFERDINLLCVGNVNIRALNSFVGGVQGLLSSTMEDGTSGLTFQNFLGGAIQGFSRNEFRDVSLSVSGSSNDISIHDLKIAPVPVNETAPELNEAERRREKLDERIRINLEFPVGPGENKNQDSVGSQIGGQVLQHALKGILSF
jgi:hypothetical protein